jgi:hypothetical protein
MMNSTVPANRVRIPRQQFSGVERAGEPRRKVNEGGKKEDRTCADVRHCLCRHDGLSPELLTHRVRQSRLFVLFILFYFTHHAQQPPRKKEEISHFVNSNRKKEKKKLRTAGASSMIF